MLDLAGFIYLLNMARKMCGIFGAVSSLKFNLVRPLRNRRLRSFFVFLCPLGGSPGESMEFGIESKGIRRFCLAKPIILCKIDLYTVNLCLPRGTRG